MGASSGLKITKAVFPVAGLGSRFLPATKASPKEMMPVVDKPLIQYAVEEAVAAGMTDMVFITGRNKRAIEDHFDTAYELESELAARGKLDLLASLKQTVPAHVNFIFIRQHEPRGLGHAVLCAQAVVHDEPFAVILADDLIAADTPVMAQMTAVFARHACSVLAVQEVPRAQTGRYGIVSASPLAPGVAQVHGIVEKPTPELAPSTLGVVGRYIFTPRIFHHLSRLRPAGRAEIELTDGLAAMLQAEEPLLACRFSGERFDCGDKLGYLMAQVAYGLKNPELSADFRSYLAGLP